MHNGKVKRYITLQDNTDGSYVSYERGHCGDPMCDGDCMINEKVISKGASSDLEFDRPPKAPACPHNANPHSCPTCRLPFAEFIVKSIQRSIEEFSGSGEEVRLNQRLWDKIERSLGIYARSEKASTYV